MVVKNGKGVDGSMTMEDVYALMEAVILKEPLFLDIFYTPDLLVKGLDLDVDNLDVEDTRDTFRVSDFKTTD